MKKIEGEENYNKNNFQEKDLFSDQFNSILSPNYTFESLLQKEQFFISYCIPRKMQDIIISHIQQRKNQKDELFQEILTKIFEDSQIKKYTTYLMNLEYKYSAKAQKDRKTSFYRTILKHLKQINQKTQANKFGSYKFIAKFQQKLSKNTISNQDIQELLRQYQDQIVDYLKSPKSLNDFIFKNKSKANKSYYVFHLKSLAIEAQNGRLAEYPFFSKSNLSQQIRRMAKILYEQYLKCQIQKNQQKQIELQNSTQIKSNISNIEKFQNCNKIQIMQQIGKVDQQSVVNLAEKDSYQMIIDELFNVVEQHKFNNLFYGGFQHDHLF